MADTDIERSQGHSRNEFRQKRPKRRANRLLTEKSLLRWPSRPGQEQYEWEEPRVVADNVNATGGSSTKQQKRKKRRTPTNDSSLHGKESKDINETESKLGGASDGPSLRGVDPTANRVDRLRLLGNGVVPNTCERAIRILLERLHSE